MVCGVVDDGDHGIVFEAQVFTCRVHGVRHAHEISVASPARFPFLSFGVEAR